MVALSGDVGFYSGARKLVELFGEVSIQPEIICGISSVVYFMSKIGLSWDDAKIVSAHGKNCNLISLIRSCEKTFAILGTADVVAELSKKLTINGMSDVILYVGENMSYPNEKIFEKPAHELVNYKADPLSVICAYNPQAEPLPATNGMPEEVILHALDHVKVRGRVENVPTGRGYSVLIDFAHNGVSTESVLKTLRGYNQHRIIAIFGCGGKRS